MTVRLTQAKHGRFLVLDNDWYVGRLLLRDGEYSEEEVLLFSRLVGPDDVVFEAGSNIGAHTVPLAKMAKQVVAWEPQRHLYHLLCGNLALNNCHNVSAYPAALGAAQGHLYPPKLDYDELFNFGGVPLRRSWSDEVKFENADPVVVYTIDQLQVKELKLLKVDVEGMEVDVVNGAKATIVRCRPYLYLEDTEEGNQPLYDLVGSLGYRVIQHHVKLLGPGDDFSQHPDCVIASKNILCIPNELPNPTL